MSSAGTANRIWLPASSSTRSRTVSIPCPGDDTPVIDGHDRGQVGPIVHERVGVEGRNAFIVQERSICPNRQASGGALRQSPHRNDEENSFMPAAGPSL